MQFPTLQNVVEFCRCEESIIEYLIKKQVFIKPNNCSNCNGSEFYLYGKKWRCGLRRCRREKSVCDNSFFAGSKLPVNDILLLGYCWLSKMSNETLLMIMQHSSATITAYFEYFRQLVADSLDLEDMVIGGDGVVVEIDEAKFGKRKHHRGHSVEGCWVLGGVERTPERKIFLVEVPDRKADTLLAVISKYVAEGSTVYTDCFSSYSSLGELFEHQTVNHSANFRDPVTGCHTNTIEGTWCGIKMRIKARSRVSGSIDLHLAEFIWRRRWQGNIWNGFIDALRKVGYNK
jgi:transposase-like protein